jgi:hypothetical protein
VSNSIFSLLKGPKAKKEKGKVMDEYITFPACAFLQNKSIKRQWK